MSPSTTTTRRSYLDAPYGLAAWLLTKDHKRIAMLYLISVTIFFVVGGLFAVRHPARAADAGRRSVDAGHVQQAVHAPRRDHDLLLPPSVDPGDARQLPAADHDRREGPRVSAHQPDQLVHLRHRRDRDARRRLQWRAGHRLDVLHALQLDRVTDGRFDRGARRVHHRVLVDSHGAEFHRHGAPHAGAGHDLVPAAALRLGALRDEPRDDPGHACRRHHGPARLRRAHAPPRILRSDPRRRPGALPASVLVLFAPGGLHHDSAGHGGDERARRRRVAQAGVRLQLRRVLEPRHRDSRLPRLGPSSVREQPVNLRGPRVLHHHDARGRAVSREDVQLGGHDVQGIGHVGVAHVLGARVSWACSRSAG